VKRRSVKQRNSDVKRKRRRLRSCSSSSNRQLWQLRRKVELRPNNHPHKLIKLKLLGRIFKAHMVGGIKAS
jgi:hypothetical protein